MTAAERETICATVKETLRALGVDAAHPMEMQRDFAWLRRNRTVSEKISVKIAVIGGLVTLVVTLVASAFTGLWD